VSAKPRCLKYSQAIEAAEQRIADALPEIIDRLVSLAKDGDLKASTYLLDRILGRSAGAKTAAADDRESPYTEEDFEEDEAEHDMLYGFLKTPKPSGASEGA
jgi:hypothetical protein